MATRKTAIGGIEDDTLKTDLDDANAPVVRNPDEKARPVIVNEAYPDPYHPATKAEIDAALKLLRESEATSVVLYVHVGDPLVVEGKAVKLGSEGAGSGRGFYALAKGAASASKVATDEAGGEGSQPAYATSSTAKRGDGPAQ